MSIDGGQRASLPEPAAAGAPGRVSVEADAVAGPHGPVAVRRYSPPSGVAPLAPPLVWLHGGAFVSGGLDQLESHAVGLELAARGIPVTTVDYRLTGRTSFLRPSPRARVVRHPTPVDDVAAVLADARRRSLDAVPGSRPGDAADARTEAGSDSAASAGVLIGGASAGACLAAAAALEVVTAEAQSSNARSPESGRGDAGAAASASSDLATAPIRGLLLAYGVFHAAMPPRSAELRSRVTGYRRFTHTPRAYGLMTRNYAGSRAALADPRAFPGGHPLAGLPPTLMLDADRDVLRASGERFAAELAEHAVPLERHVLPGSTHAFLHRPADPDFGRGIDLIADWAARR
ncbi:alpha/beta hydrolase fold domain-containing protein [Schumannella luteola]|uniref:Acetyl esterase/lipase n=1 Tax=Schumannella luteola TaxID=472059 RepID=A0A852YGI8_9MICO|nr:alpha/beta hydrolase fold domain-containing protein [Schumannella luteola]NYG98138.1 acetyl esterase/lipase [Schumannella luteola]TPX01857.1 alpha/beta hydrolase [Schumannella luteola]